MARIGPKQSIFSEGASGVFSLREAQQEAGSDNWPTMPLPGSQLWRLYSYNNSSYGLWDIDSGSFEKNNSSLVSSIQTSGILSPTSLGRYAVYRSASADPFASIPGGGWDAGPGSMFNGGRTAWSDAIGHWIGFYFSSFKSTDDMSGCKISLRTYMQGRPTRCPRGMYLQYYQGTLGSNYSTDNWVTYATLVNTSQSAGNPTFSNITEGSTITL